MRGDTCHWSCVGDLVAGFLTSGADVSCVDYCQSIDHDQYEGYNIIVGDIR